MRGRRNGRGPPKSSQIGHLFHDPVTAATPPVPSASLTFEDGRTPADNEQHKRHPQAPLEPSEPPWPFCRRRPAPATPPTTSPSSRHPTRPEVLVHGPPAPVAPVPPGVHPQPRRLQHLPFATVRARCWIFLIPAALYMVAHGGLAPQQHPQEADQPLRPRGPGDDLRSRTGPAVGRRVPADRGRAARRAARTPTGSSPRLDWPGDGAGLGARRRRPTRGRASSPRSTGSTTACRPDRGRIKKAGNLRYGYEQTQRRPDPRLRRGLRARVRTCCASSCRTSTTRRSGSCSRRSSSTPTAAMSWLQRGAGATQELFYRWIQPSRRQRRRRDLRRHQRGLPAGGAGRRRRLRPDRALRGRPHRRQADEGGIPAPVRAGPGVEGPVPGRPASGFLNQQYRWCTGSMSLLVDRGVPPQTRLISERQRLCFWSGFLYYITTAVNGFVAPLARPHHAVAVPGLDRADELRCGCSARSCSGTSCCPCVMRGHWRMDVLRVQQLYSFAHADRDLPPAPGPDAASGWLPAPPRPGRHPTCGLDRAGLQDLRAHHAAGDRRRPGPRRPRLRDRGVLGDGRPGRDRGLRAMAAPPGPDARQGAGPGPYRHPRAAQVPSRHPGAAGGGGPARGRSSTRTCRGSPAGTSGSTCSS